jgi:hypothetical protein
MHLTYEEGQPRLPASRSGISSGTAHTRAPRNGREGRRMENHKRGCVKGQRVWMVNERTYWKAMLHIHPNIAILIKNSLKIIKQMALDLICLVHDEVRVKNCEKGRHTSKQEAYFYQFMMHGCL